MLIALLHLRLNAGARGAEQYQMPHMRPQQRIQYGEVTALVVAAGEQDDSAIKARHGFLHRPHVGAFGIVVIADAVAFAHQRQAMWQAVRRFQRALNSGVRYPPNGGGRDGRHHVLAVVRAGKPYRVEWKTPGDRFRSPVDDGIAVDKTAKLHRFTSERDRCRSRFAPLLPHPGIVPVQHRHIAGLLRGEQRGLGAPVLIHAGVAVEVVRREVEQQGNLWLERVHPFQLETRHLHHRCFKGAFCQASVDERRPEIATDEGMQAGFPEHIAKKHGCCALAVRPAHRQDRTRQGARRKFNLAQNGDTPTHGTAQQHVGARHSGAGHDNVDAAEEILSAITDVRFDVRGKGGPRQRVGRALDQPDARTVVAQEGGDTLARLARADDKKLLAGNVEHHRNFSVLRAMRAQMIEMIQNRTMICGSGHPKSSK
ncbi:MAG: hypothetical protein H6Q33_4090 [Deltaproteobacteria bacterium]|nr:hypothetical protein [Deltaproteobacteria bacterium]